MAETGRPRIAIVGAGALGSYFGIRLAAAGYPVGFLLRSDFEAVARDGLRLTLCDGTVQHIGRPQIARRPEELGVMDWVIIGLKTTRNDLLGGLLRPLTGPRTLLVTVQNGLGNVEALQALFPHNPVVGALCQIGVNREAPGCIRSFVPKDGSVQLGAGDMAGPQHLEAVLAAFTAAGIHTRIVASLGEALWRKLMWNVPFNGLTVAVGGVGTDVVCNDPALRAVARALMEEIRTAAGALGYPIEPEYTDKLLTFTDKIGAYMASSVLDWRAGQPVEVEAIFRKPLLAGTAAGVPMPHLAAVAAILGALRRPQET